MLCFQAKQDQVTGPTWEGDEKGTGIVQDKKELRAKRGDQSQEVSSPTDGCLFQLVNIFLGILP